MTAKRRSVVFAEDVPVKEESTVTNSEAHFSPEAAIKAMSFRCPGLHGEGCRQKVYPSTFGAFLRQKNQIVIPAFQRMYCWDENLATTWLKDVWQGERDGVFQTHRTGKVFMKKFHSDSYICVDGQQRFTTTLLLLAAIRDATNLITNRNPECEEQLKNLIASIQDILYKDFAAFSTWKEQSQKLILNKEEIFPYGVSISFSMLIPSMVDRESFFEVLLLGELCKDPAFRQSTIASHQGRIKVVFDQILLDKLTNLATNELKCDYLISTFNQCLDNMDFMCIEILNDANLSQVFLWLQEKTLLGLSRLLYNPTPGVEFCAADLIKNVLFADFLEMELDVQEKLYEKYWFKPFLKKYNTDGMDELIKRYLEKQTSEPRYISDTETKMNLIMDMFGEALECDFPGFRLYAKFFSYYESLASNSDSKRVGEDILDRLRNFDES